MDEQYPKRQMEKEENGERTSTRARSSDSRSFGPTDLSSRSQLRCRKAATAFHKDSENLSSPRCGSSISGNQSFRLRENFSSLKINTCKGRHVRGESKFERKTIGSVQ